MSWVEYLRVWRWSRVNMTLIKQTYVDSLRVADQLLRSRGALYDLRAPESVSSCGLVGATEAVSPRSSAAAEAEAMSGSVSGRAVLRARVWTSPSRRERMRLLVLATLFGVLLDAGRCELGGWTCAHVVALLSVLFSDYLRVQGADLFNLVADSFKTIWLYYVKMWNLSVPQKTNISCVTWDTLGNLGWAVWSTVLRVAAGFTRRCDFLFVTSSLFDSFTSVKSVKMLLMFPGNRLWWECEDEESSSDPAVISSKWSAVLAVWQKYSPKIKFLLISSVMDECSRLLARCEVIRVCWCSTWTFIRSRDGAVTLQINVCCHFNNYTTNVCQNDDISQKQRLILQVCQWTHNGPVYGGPELPKQK